MNRKDEIRLAAVRAFPDEAARCCNHERIAFREGAEWADANSEKRDEKPCSMCQKRELELSKYKEALSEKLTEDQGYCQEYTGIVILKEQLEASKAREAKLVEEMHKCAVTKGVGNGVKHCRICTKALAEYDKEFEK